MENKYEDIINLPHHVSATRKKMSMHDRAAQFSPFAALTGYDLVIKEEARLTDAQMEIDEAAKELLNRKIAFLMEHIEECPEVEVTYFEADDKKAGGAYSTLRGNVKKIDSYKKTILMNDGSIIYFEDILKINR